ncbi:hypothetical protein [Plantibacter cousiniae (nom. nud.)]|uniref:hypothetical protein n=1 Tax=Plantibacter cousiniae (nom. nud.) TaxID=199709 RepID=UPI001E3CA26A|nr:hypothetical protein [Plantibacter cousiniae]
MQRSRPAVGAPAPRVATLAASHRGTLIVSVVAWSALVGFVVCTIGPALIGVTSFLGTDLLVSFAPWQSTIAMVQDPTNRFIGDTIDTVVPQTALIVEAAREGSFAAWNPYAAGGAELAGLPNSGVYSPLSLPWWFLPVSAAPGYVKLLEIVVITLGMSLLLRRWRLPNASWAVASLIFASSGFMISWTNWPQTRVAALLPLLFWALDRIAIRPRPVDVAILGLVVASLLLGGFPAVTGYALYAGGAYLLVRSIVVRRRWRGVLSAVGTGAAGVVLGVGLSAWQLVPFAVNASSVLDLSARAATSGASLHWGDLASLVVPEVVGDVDAGLTWGSGNPIERLSYIGVGALALVAAAGLIVPRGRRLRPSVTFVVVALALSIVLTFVGGPILAAFQELPVFSNNPIARLRVLVGFFLALLAAVGFAAVIDPTSLRAEVRLLRRARPRRHLWWRILALVVVVVIGCVAVFTVRNTLWTLPVDVIPAMREHIGAVGAFAAFAVLVIVAAWLGGRRVGILAGCILPIMLVVPAVVVANEWWPQSPPETVYPSTATHRFLERELGESRYASVDQTMLPGTNTIDRLRSVGGHAFHTSEWQDLLEAVEPDAFFSRTYSALRSGDLATSIRSPILDRLAVKYVVDDPEATVLGQPEGVIDRTGRVQVADGDRVRSAVQSGPVRGVVFALPDSVVGEDDPDGVRITLDIRDAATDERIASTTTWLPALTADQSVAVAGEDIPADRAWVAELRFDSIETPAPVAADPSGRLGLSLVRPADDGLRIAHTGDATVYERTTALDRIRWASTQVTETDPAEQVARMASGSLPRAAVLLERPKDAPKGASDEAGSTATVTVLPSDTTRMEIDVVADGAGWVVVADSLRRPGWTATIDGKATELLPAEHAAAAVAVPTGEHRVVVQYTVPGQQVGLRVTAASLLVAVVLVVIDGFLFRRRRRSLLSGDPGLLG